jgi:hypothetical protein
MPLIIAVELEDRVVNAAANLLYNAYHQRNAMVFGVELIVPSGDMGETRDFHTDDVVYLVGHADSWDGFEDFDLKHGDPVMGELRETLRAARQTILVGCSTADPGDQVRPYGFQVKPYAEILSKAWGIEVVAATGPLQVGADRISVLNNLGDEPWVGYSQGAIRRVGSNPIGTDGYPALGDGTGSLLL